MTDVLVVRAEVRRLGPGARSRLVRAGTAMHVDVAVELLLECLHDGVARPGQLAGDVVRQLELLAH